MLPALFFFVYALSFAVCQYQIRFDPNNSPPTIIPLDAEDFVFSVPLNQMISKPIIVFIEFTNGTGVTRGSLATENYEVSTVDTKTAYFSRVQDKWANSGGKLCQKSAWWLNYPQRLNRIHHKERCGSDVSPSTLIVPAFNGKLIIDWIYHKHDSVPENSRVFRVQMRRKNLKADSNAFMITVPAHHLTITQEPPKSMFANHNFTVAAEIRLENDTIVENGLDSVVYIDLTIGYHFKTFSNLEEDRMLVKSSPYRLAGKGSSLHQGNYDWIIRKRAVKGRVIFDDIVILDKAENIKLNLTMTTCRDPWVRIPYCTTCYDDVTTLILSKDRTEITYPEPDSYLMNKLKAVILTQSFTVKEQIMEKLAFSKYTKDFFQTNKEISTNMLHITRNIEIPGRLSVTATDITGQRIFSGVHSKFKLTYQTIPKNICISADATTEVTGGYGNIDVTVCQIIDNVTIEIIPNVQPKASIFTPNLKVGGHLNIAHFGDFSYSGEGNTIESHVNSFIKFAAYDINKGKIMPSLSKQGFDINVVSYDTKSDSQKAYKFVLELEEKELPKDKLNLIISSTTQEITKDITPELWQLGAALFSTSNTAIHFSNKESYPLFNRICWADIETFKSVIQACLDRMWTELVIVREKNTHFTEEYYHTSHESGLEIKGVVDIDSDRIVPGEISYFKYEMGRIKSFGTKIILLISTSKLQPYIWRAAQLAGIDALHGYQWLLYSSFAWQFPFGNKHVCRQGMLCTEAFASTYLFSETYNITGYHTEDWVRVLGYHFSVDRFFYKGGRVSYRSPIIGARMALGYDAVLLFAAAIDRIVSKRETITALKVARMARNIVINGLTGKFKLDDNGDRSGFFGFLAQINPYEKGKMESNIFRILTFTRVLLKQSDNSQLEIPYISFGRGPLLKDYQSKAIVPVSPKYNLRTFPSVSGVVDLLRQTIIRNPAEPWPSIPYTRTEYIAPIFTCEYDCGKNVLSPENVNVYDTGQCEIGGRCECNPGFHGNFCKQITCKCEYGTCISAVHCSCHAGWKGLQCNIAICDHCKFGKCIKPDNCKCNSNLWIGATCETHIGLVVGPLLLGTIIIVGIAVLLIKYIMKHADRNAALSNNEWIVEWPYVTQYVADEVTASKTSVGDLSSLISQKDINTFLWKNERWYGKAVSSRTIDPKIQEMRLEMVDLVKLRHRNLIIYGGACLTSPNVCLFLEVADKGSLNDILLNDAIDLGWEFKFSFLKDICAGMRFLHEKTSIGSHGRLKSRTCLIDSRWTLRISGFGAHTIRFGRYRIPSETKEEIKHLFWTAPELLENVTCLDDVKNGTMSGDTYSFTIIVSEVITRAEPYDYELENISDKALFDMITDNDSRERKAATKTWEDIGGSSMFICRPILKEEYLPESSLQKKQFIKMLDDGWNENPSGRPTFDKLIHILNQIHPVKGELIDNLINLLESYSTNLEMIVVERTRELEVNKARAEQLLSQMLPRKVTAELKLGRKIPPEIFPTATIFFSDIVDFSRICQDSSPFQIVDFLNETYNAFDEVLNSYDVYKVETISDSYMVVSGVPESNGLQHASEIATMALDLMSTVTTFQIPHKPKNTLQLRIGMNSGPVVAGVVGQLMPRYCLFGDTVNTASRMESSSQALCIQVSDSTAAILDELGGFDMESRGQREVKGRGLMTTYWLWGKDTFDKPLPDQSLALSLSQHKFK